MPRLIEHQFPPHDGELDFKHFEQEFERLREIMRGNLPSIDEDILHKAFLYSYEMHEGQRRKTGVPYIEHPLQVARILAHLKMDQDTVMAGLLHDVLEDCKDKGVTLTGLNERFGEHVAILVDGVTKIGDLKFQSFEQQQSVNYRKMLLHMSKDLRVIFVKLADRLHNMRTIDALKPEKAERIARETLEVYAPLAHRFGMGSIKWELEDLCLKVMEPEFYQELIDKIELKREEREAIIEDAVSPIRQRLDEYGIRNYRLFGRPKHFYSIYNKIHKRQKSFEEILDLFAIRIMVEKVEDCYFALGVVHNHYTPIQERFSDYIATPKSNGYQSLHTKVVGPRGRTLEVQIRTEEMNRIAEYGLAAHWLYKEGESPTDEQQDRFFAWIKQVLSADGLEESSQEFLDSFKINLYQDEIFVFSPKGDLYKLPRGATGIDFAFAVHTNVGLTCIGAKENGRIVPLDQALNSGSTVEVITSKNQTPSVDWLQIVRSHKARARIKRWLKESQYHQSLDLGREVLKRELDKRRLKVPEQELEQAIQGLGYHSAEKGIAAIGSGDLPIGHLMRKLEPPVEKQSENLLTRIFRRGRDSESSISIQGSNNMVVHFARCCQPLPGDDIVGFVVTGQGVKIHRRTCANISQMLAHPERMIDVNWDSSHDHSFNSRIRLVATDRRQLIRDITETLSKQDVNILQFTMRKQDDLAIGKYVLEVKSLSHLTQIMKKLRGIRKVIRVERHDQGGDW